MMAYFYCVSCEEVEIVSQKCESIIHKHTLPNPGRDNMLTQLVKITLDDFNDIMRLQELRIMTEDPPMPTMQPVAESQVVQFGVAAEAAVRNVFNGVVGEEAQNGVSIDDESETGQDSLPAWLTVTPGEAAVEEEDTPDEYAWRVENGEAPDPAAHVRDVEGMTLDEIGEWVKREAAWLEKSEEG
jgi:hypothetical protein